jgi:hypothetical protein
MTSRSEKIAAEKKAEEDEKNLDASDVAEAQAEITGLIQDGFLDRGPDWVKTWHELGFKWSDGEDPIVTLPEANLEEFVERAKANVEVFELAKFIAALRIKNGLAVPNGFGDLMALYLRDEFSPASRGRGPKVQTWGRDFLIARTMQILESRWDHRLVNRRKGSKKRRKSISQIVHEALAESKIAKVDVERIQKIRSYARKSNSLEDTHTMRTDWVFDDYAEPGDRKDDELDTPVRRV